MASNKRITKMANFLDVSILVKISSIVETIGFVLHLIGFVSPYWRALQFNDYLKFDDVGNRLDSYVVIQGFDEGLWRRCVNSICADIDVAGRDWLQAVRTFECIGLAASVVALCAVLFYVLKPDSKYRSTIYLVSAISSIITGGSIVLAVLIYGISIKVALSWSFGLAAVGGILFGISGILLPITFVIEMKKLKNCS